MDPEKVLGMFFSWTEGADLTILKDGQRIGQMSLSTQEKKMSSGDEGLREVSMAGSLGGMSVKHRAGAGGARDKEFHWRGVMSVTDDMNFPKGDFVLNMPKIGMGAQFGFDNPAGTISVDVRSGDKEIIKYKGSPTGLKDLPELGWIGRLLPLDALLGGRMSEGMMKAWAPELTGRYGSTMVAGRRMLVYQLAIRGKNSSSGNQPRTEVKLYLSETGEPLRIETEWGYEALAAVLVPIDLYDGGE